MFLFAITKVVLGSLAIALAEILRRMGLRGRTSYGIWVGVMCILVVPPLFSIPVWKKEVNERVNAPLALVPSAPMNATGQQGSFPKQDSFPKEPSWGGLAEMEVQSTLSSVFEAAKGWWGLLMAAWIVGAAFFIARSFLRLRMMGRLVRAAQDAPRSVAERATEISGELGLSEPLGVRIANGLFSPFLWHSARGTSCIVLPQSLIGALEGEALEAVLRHECIHFHRKDSVRHVFDELVACIWWWFPGAWLAQTRLREAEELCVDAELLRQSPSSKKAYATALVETATFLSSESARPFLRAAVPTFAGRDGLRRRIENIMSDSPAKPEHFIKMMTMKTATIASSFLLAAAMFCGLSIAEEPDSKKIETAVKAESDQPSDDKMILEYVEAKVPKSDEGYYQLELFSVHYSAGDPPLMKVISGLMIETSGRLASLPVKTPGESNRLRFVNRSIRSCCAGQCAPHGHKLNTKGNFIACEVFAEFPNGVPKFNPTWRYKVAGKLNYRQDAKSAAPVPVIVVEKLTLVAQPLVEDLRRVVKKKEADLLQNKARVDAIQNEIRGLDLTKPKNVERLKKLHKELQGFDLGRDQEDVDAAKDDVDECQKFLREVTP